VRQRNDTQHAWSFAATHATEDIPEQPPFVVEPGETVDRPNLLDGWTAVDDYPEPTANDSPAKTVSRKRAAAADTDKDGGEPK
jgi:hypothetical protein